MISSIAIILIIFSLIMTVFGILLVKRRNVPGAITSIFFMLSAAIYCFGYAMELLHNDLSTIMFWIRFEYLGISFIPAIWMVLALQYTRNNNKVDSRFFWALWIIPIITLVSNYTNDLHHLFYTNVELIQNDFLIYASVSRGPLYWLHIAYFNISFIIASGLYLIMYQRTIKTVRKQISFMLLGSLTVWVFTLVYVLNVTSGIDIIPFGAFIMGIFFFFGLYKFKLFKINPVVVEQLVHSMEDAMILFDHENEVMLSNAAAKMIFPKLVQNKDNVKVDELCHQDSLLKSLFENNYNKRIEWIFSCDSKVTYYDVSITMIYSNRHLVGKILLLTDITEKKKIIAQLNDFAYKDGLTEIYNRRFFRTKLELEFDRSNRYKLPLSLILLDIDLFKNFNDKYGHHAGDYVLTQLTSLCKTKLREKDVFARYGGEEFIIMLPETTIDVAYQIAEELRFEIEQTRSKFENIEIRFTSSFGVAVNNNPSTTSVDEFINQVDKAMYQSKSAGRNKVTKFE
ncbi:MAG TPA: histidine kinase N-terminal 7TM domain-containing protein [Bacilli bacterium]|nr:histidine kinase N-terminal 7TM domain-containing protein [Bacilli bacterium]